MPIPAASDAPTSEPSDTALADPAQAETTLAETALAETALAEDVLVEPETAVVVAEASAPASGRRTWPGWLRELVIVAAVYFTYSISRNLIPDQVEQAQRNARSILDAEKLLGLDIELGINHWGADRLWLIIPANYYYATLHLSVTLIVMIWLYRRRKAVYARCRSVLLTMTLMALASYWLYPLAPPRLMAGAAYIDTVKEHVLWGFTPSDDMVSLSNQYAAMPSMHVGWALWVGVILVAYGRHRLVRGLGVAYPLATVFVVMVTANHFILDAIAAVVFFLVAIAAVDVVGRVTGRRSWVAEAPGTVLESR
ncbi:phosphatase PAP2 family protein [Actinotalea fermentans]|uniref:Inositolphosphotransferase Aur1/Ipt1 domain-containing protein n=1 Tax=Actinotalea fermentans TaxID=43671 RepID=A0A511Z1M5_9CELL|nr:phosphatase PAP2 family protein [Actinotalea fermentans]KGM15205.1 hypothetical protein N867_10835 [Actinotalea fermentans ATCC 43279 = JCM 9966 = DSM 3133]GEN81344.1 hypothetical protein AFE02nite_30780 [Actinotalea fermentans]